MSETGQYLLYVLSNIFGGRSRKCPGYDIVGVSGLEMRLSEKAALEVGTTPAGSLGDC